jgi:energy-coupling factor transporter transmembrane protein EcfT
LFSFTKYVNIIEGLACPAENLREANKKMDSRYKYLGIITAVLAFIGLLARYFMPLHEPYQSTAIIALFIIGFIAFGYGYGDGWKWPVWLGSILVLIAFVLLANTSVLWFVLAIGLGTISYAYERQTPKTTH